MLHVLQVFAGQPQTLLLNQHQHQQVQLAFQDVQINFLTCGMELITLQRERTLTLQIMLLDAIL